MMLQEALHRVVEGVSLSAGEAEAAMREIMEGRATEAQIGAYLTALRMKGETADEIAGSARAMRALATPVVCRHPRLVDTCGTGGDGRGSFNISTAAALVVAGAGQPVAKHGNRGVSSRSGSADVLEALGVRIDLDPGQMAYCLDEVGIAFLYAPRLHAAMRFAARPRRELGMRTIFNLLGPLTNPAGARRQLLGVYDASLVGLVARVLALVGTEHALVVHGDGFDELTTTGPNLVAEVTPQGVRVDEVDARDLGLPRAGRGDLVGGTPQDNAEMIVALLSGERGPRRDVVVLNGGAALYASGQAGSLREGISLAARAIDTGRAMATLGALQRFTAEAADGAAGGEP
ncbi:MAG: anthranilate phosphoribosyltransferase [Bacillota bacterium]